jgi:hypothetical protein
LLLLNYYGRAHNLEIFSLTCLIGTVSALGPVIAGDLRDRSGGFASGFQLFAGVIGVILLAAFFMRPPQRQSASNDTETDPVDPPLATVRSQLARDPA